MNPATSPRDGEKKKRDSVGARSSLGGDSNWTAVTGEESDSDDAIRKQESAMTQFHARHYAAVR